MFVSDMSISMSDVCELTGAPLPGIKATQGSGDHGCRGLRALHGAFEK